jgi:bifunctional non-homologous end joining protein LigD
MLPILPVVRKDPFSDPAWSFELKYDGFRGLADTVRGRMLSKNDYHLKRYDALLDSLPPGCVFDGEIAVLDGEGRPHFNALLFRRRPPVYVAFDVLFANGEDLRPLPLATRKAVLKQLLRGREDLGVVDGIAGDGVALYEEVCRLDLEGIVAKRLDDPYGPETKWFKVLNPAYSQKEGRGDLFEARINRGSKEKKLPNEGAAPQ